MKLARKFTLALALLGVTVLVTHSAIDLERDWRRMDLDMRADHLVLGRVLAGELQREWDGDGETAALAMLNATRKFQGTVAARWVWLDAEAGAEFAPRADLPGRVAGTEVRSFELGSGRRTVLVTYVPVTVAGRLGALELTESEAAKYHALTVAIWSTLVSTAAVFALYLGATFLLGRRMVGRPLKLLEAHANRVAQGDFSAQVLLHQRDELGALATTLNAMTEALRQGRDALATETNARLAALEAMRHADRLSTVGKLAAGVAHELGTPINVVFSRGKMIASGEEQGVSAQASGRIIAEQAQAMTHIIRQLLDFARTRQPRRTREKLRAICERTVLLLGPLASKQSLRLQVDEVADLELEVDAAQLQQVLTNLIVNAIHASTEPGAVKLSAQVVRRRREGATSGADEVEFVRVDVEDAGHGIRPEDLPHLFEPFFTTKEVGQGTGLGLSVSFGMVREHGGWIEVESTPGSGSRFSVFLPRSPE